MLTMTTLVGLFVAAIIVGVWWGLWALRERWRKLVVEGQLEAAQQWELAERADTRAAETESVLSHHDVRDALPERIRHSFSDVALQSYQHTWEVQPQDESGVAYKRCTTCGVTVHVSYMRPSPEAGHVHQWTTEVETVEQFGRGVVRSYEWKSCWCGARDAYAVSEQ